MFTLEMQAAQARVKASLIDLLLVANDGGVNGLTTASASIEVDADGELLGAFTVGYLDAQGNTHDSAGSSL